MKRTELDLKFELQSSLIAEITNTDAWKGAGVVALDSAVVQEITAGDEKPFFIDFVAVYEGMSSNERVYGKEALDSCVDAMVGVNMYKGHQEPGTESWKYREPVGRIVAAKVEQITLPDGSKVMAAKGKAYITEADPKLRSDIKKRMAGSVSVLGNARMIRQANETKKTVTHFHKPLKSVDFCNPGTGGLSHAGVTAVVSEMAAQTTETELRENQDQNMKLTKPQLLTEYSTEITELVGEQIGQKVTEVANARRELAEEKEAFKDTKAKLEGEVAEMKTKVTAAEKVGTDWKAKFEAERDARIAADLKVFANEQIAEMKNLDGANEKHIDLALKRVGNIAVVEGDLEKSKTAFSAAFKEALEDVEELAAEMSGGSGGDDDDDEKPPSATKKHKNNPGKKSTALSRVLSPELKKQRTDRGATV